MLQLHDRMKEDASFQASAEQERIDRIAHAIAEPGRFAVERMKRPEEVNGRVGIVDDENGGVGARRFRT